MKAVVFYGLGDIRISEQPDPKIQQRTDAIVRLTASAICGTDLHMVRGTMPGMEPGTILGHEGVGIVEEVGPDVRNLKAAIEAYKAFDTRKPGWIKVKLEPAMAHAKAS